MTPRLRSALVMFASSFLLFCGPPRVSEPEPLPKPVPVHTLPIDDSPKEEPRLVPPETYMRTYLQIFGGLAPLAGQRRARGSDGDSLFDTWDDYFSTLGLPDHRLDLPRSLQANALMVATFERIGIALCDRAVEHDIKGVPFAYPPASKPAQKGPPPLAERIVYAFDAGDPATAEAFAPKFDVLHRTFLGYPAALAPTDRTHRFFEVFGEVKRRRAARATTPGAQHLSRFSPSEAAWASVCYGLVRHPEFHLY